MAMTAGRWQLIRNTFELALEYEAAERDRIIELMCGDDTESIAEVRKMIAADEAAEDFLETPAAELGAKTILGARVGSYQILEEIGRGGMGTVYRAIRADDEFRKQVAIKVVAYADHGELLDRFKQERQILANLDHPYIAKLLDGGTTEDGRPYLVMEFVQGLPIDQYCTQRNLSLTERIELFRKVCSAVHHAHRNDIVHRDLKPGNILVTADGTPKMLDFGIAKILRAELLPFSPVMTRTGMRPMTVDYASPEQIRAESITASSDVYTLGVILYELLTGQSPYGARGNEQIDVVRRICDTPPDPPSKSRRTVLLPANLSLPERSPQHLARKLRGDLDAIVLKTLAKSPQDRYSSAEALANDLGRYLAGYPVAAREKDFLYQLSKRVTRRSVVLIASTAVLLLTAGIVAEEVRLREQRTDQLRLAAALLGTDGPPGVEDLARVRQFLDAAPREDTRLLARLYARLGELQSADPQAAAQSFRQSLDLVSRVETKIALADAEAARGDSAAATEAFRQLLPEAPGLANLRLGEYALLRGDAAHAVNYLRAATAEFERQGQTQELAGALVWLAKAQTGQEQEATTRRALGLFEKLTAPANASAEALDAYARALLICEPAELRSPARAVELTRRANDTTAWQNPRYLQTFARASGH